MQRVRRYLRTPKGLLIAVLAVLLVPAVWHTGPGLVAPGLLGAVLAGGLCDLVVLRFRRQRWTFPDGAILTGLIVAMVLSPYEPWYVAASTTAIGVISKYIVRSRGANTFNPAALSLVASFYLFSSGHSWWGALPELPAWWIVLLLAAGVFVSDRVKKLPSAIAFLGAYFVLFTGTAYFGNTAGVAEVFREPDVHAATYFAFFMVTDPPTSPPRARDQVAFGVVTGVATWLAFVLVGAAWWLPGGLLVANALESVRRVRERTHRQARLGSAVAS